MTKKEFAAALDSALKAVRKEYGFTQEKMAAVLGISKKTLVEIEKGRSSLGWTGAAAFAAIFRESGILQAQFGGDLDDLVEALAFAEAEPQYPKTMGGRVWWREIWKEKGYRIQQNVVSGHFRLLDRENGFVYTGAGAGAAKRGITVSVWVQNARLHRYNYLFYCAATGGQTMDMISLR